MKIAAVLAVLLLAPIAHADSLSVLIKDKSAQAVSVYEIEWVKNGIAGKALVNANSVTQVMLAAKAQLKLNDSEIVSIKRKQ